MPFIKVVAIRMYKVASLPRQDERYRHRWVYVSKVSKQAPLHSLPKLPSNMTWIRIGYAIYNPRAKLDSCIRTSGVGI